MGLLRQGNTKPVRMWTTSQARLLKDSQARRVPENPALLFGMKLAMRYTLCVSLAHSLAKSIRLEVHAYVGSVKGARSMQRSEALGPNPKQNSL